MKKRHFNQRLAVLFLAAGLLVHLSGCIYLVVGGVGVLGGYVVSPDTVEGIIAGRETDEVWDAAIEIISIMGVIAEQNEAGGIIISKIQGSKVTVTVMKLADGNVKLTVKARRAFLPKIRLAQDVYSKIQKYLSE